MLNFNIDNTNLSCRSSSHEMEVGLQNMMIFGNNILIICKALIVILRFRQPGSTP